MWRKRLKLSLARLLRTASAHLAEAAQRLAAAPPAGPPAHWLRDRAAFNSGGKRLVFDWRGAAGNEPETGPQVAPPAEVAHTRSASFETRHREAARRPPSPPASAAQAAGEISDPAAIADRTRSAAAAPTPPPRQDRPPTAAPPAGSNVRQAPAAPPARTTVPLAVVPPAQAVSAHAAPASALPGEPRLALSIAAPQPAPVTDVSGDTVAGAMGRRNGAPPAPGAAEPIPSGSAVAVTARVVTRGEPAGPAPEPLPRPHSRQSAPRVPAATPTRVAAPANQGFSWPELPGESSQFEPEPDDGPYNPAASSTAQWRQARRAREIGGELWNG